MTRLAGHTGRRRGRGAYTLIEALLMVTILGITAAGVGNAMISSMRSTEANDNAQLIDTALVTQMEILRATWKSYSTGALSSTITIGNSTYTMVMDIEKA